jgi:hypothetical protein
MLRTSVDGAKVHLKKSWAAIPAIALFGHDAEIGICNPPQKSKQVASC